jgi:hypothetical protein
MFMMSSHDFTQRFLANERLLELDAEADRARLASLAGEPRSARRRLPLAWLASVGRRGDRSEIDREPTVLAEGAAATERPRLSIQLTAWLRRRRLLRQSS